MLLMVADAADTTPLIAAAALAVLAATFTAHLLLPPPAVSTFPVCSFRLTAVFHPLPYAYRRNPPAVIHLP